MQWIHQLSMVSVDKYTIICKPKKKVKKVMQNTLSKLFLLHFYYLTLRSVSSLNIILKIVKLIFVKIWRWHVENHHNYDGLHSKYFHNSYDNIILDHGKNNNNFKYFKTWIISFLKKLIIHFVNVETDPRLWYLERTRRLSQVCWVGLKRHSCWMEYVWNPTKARIQQSIMYVGY
jgi:hypothetical protein